MATSSKKPAVKPVATSAPAKKPAVKKVAPPAPAKKAAAPKEVAAPAKKTVAATPVKAASTPKVKSPTGKPKSPAASAKKVTYTPEERYRWIETAAYFRAEQRGFAVGHAAEDWKASEAEFDALLKG